MRIEYLSENNSLEVVNVLSSSFYNYPVMSYVLGNKNNYDERLRKLIGFFVAARILRNEPILGIYINECTLAAAAIVTLPENIPAPKKLIEHREKLWKELGEEEQERYENYGNVAGSILPSELHHHLNMIGVIPEYKGRGFSRKLIEEIEKLVTFHPKSSGLSLSTESESNAKLYLHLGFKQIGNARINNNLETWAFFKSK